MVGCGNPCNSMNSPDSVASAIVNFSTVGFMILIGTATFIPMIYELTILQKNTDKSVELLRRYPYRIISRLGGTLSIVALMLTSLLFIITGLLSLTYLLFDNIIFIKFALGLAIVILIILFVYTVCILISALSFQKHEVDKIIDYIPPNDKI